MNRCIQLGLGIGCSLHSGLGPLGVEALARLVHMCNRNAPHCPNEFAAAQAHASVGFENEADDDVQLLVRMI
jgi:hypothetical protein